MSDRFRAVRMRPRVGAAFSAGDPLAGPAQCVQDFPESVFRNSSLFSELGARWPQTRLPFSLVCVPPGTVGEPRVKNLGPLRPLDFGSGFGLAARACYLTWCVNREGVFSALLGLLLNSGYGILHHKDVSVNVGVCVCRCAKQSWWNYNH